MVTGSAGFIGTWLVKELEAAGHEVVGVDRNARWRCDLNQVDLIGWVLIRHKPDAVIHLAATVGRLNGEKDIAETILSNATMTTRVAAACGNQRVRLLYASTSEIYGDMGTLTADESSSNWTRRLPHNLYGLTKRWGEEACQLYAPKNLTIMRLSMPYGPGHPPGVGRAALTNFLDQALNRQPIPVHRGAERSWCWIGDTVRAIRILLERTESGTYNVGRDDNALPMKTVAKMACELVGAPPSLIQEVDPPTMQTVVKRLSTKKLRALGWEPRVDLEEGMSRTLRWLETQHHFTRPHLVA